MGAGVKTQQKEAGGQHVAWRQSLGQGLRIRGSKQEWVKYMYNESEDKFLEK